MEIRSKSTYPAGALSNFAPHPFVLDGVQCASMEGFLQSLKFKNQEMQKYVCSLVGIKAKHAGKFKKWQTKQTLYWRGKEYARDSDDYQELLDRAYGALAKNSGFIEALKATGDAVLTHKMGRTNIRETVLTQTEFCSRLTKLREVVNN